MKRYQFTLRHLLFLLPVVAALLVLIRFALRSTGLAAGLMVAGIGTCLFATVNAVMFIILRVIGGLSGEVYEPAPERHTQPNANAGRS